MAHECIDCGGECYCHGDIDDCIISLTPGNCHTCGCAEDEQGDDNFSLDDLDPWLCTCGHYETSGLHCARCGNQPPWGCPCSGCEEFVSDDLAE